MARHSQPFQTKNGGDPPADVWVHNAIVGERVPPDLDYLVNRLSKINLTASSRLVIEHARKIHTAYQFWRGNPDRHGFKVHGTQRLRIERFRADRGLKDDLQRLLKAACGGSLKEWERAWLGVSGKARSLIAPPAPPIVERQIDDHGNLTGFRRGAPAYRAKTITITKNKEMTFSAVVPHPQETLPRIEAVLAEREFSSKPQIDKLTSMFVLTVRDAYAALADEVGITYRPLNDSDTLNPKGGVAATGLFALAGDIDRRFGTNVLTVSRLRKKETDIGLSAVEVRNLRRPWGEGTF